MSRPYTAGVSACASSEVGFSVHAHSASDRCCRVSALCRPLFIAADRLSMTSRGWLF